MTKTKIIIRTFLKCQELLEKRFELCPSPRLALPLLHTAEDLFVGTFFFLLFTDLEISLL